jgi:hypothetical protein
MDEQQAVSYLATNGLPRVAAQGIIDVLKAESGFNPTALNPKEGAYGIAQWVGPRKAALQAYAEQQHEPVESTSLQLAFLLHELQTDERATYDRLQLATSVDEAIDIFVTGFERPEIPTEVERRAEAEAGLPFGPTPGKPAPIAAAPVEGVKRSVLKHDYHEKIIRTGKAASEHGNTLKSIVDKLVALQGHLPRYKA